MCGNVLINTTMLLSEILLLPFNPSTLRQGQCCAISSTETSLMPHSSTPSDCRQVVWFSKPPMQASSMRVHVLRKRSLRMVREDMALRAKLLIKLQPSQERKRNLLHARMAIANEVSLMCAQCSMPRTARGQQRQEQDGSVSLLCIFLQYIAMASSTLSSILKHHSNDKIASSLHALQSAQSAAEEIS